MKKIFSFLVSSVALFLLSSCGGDDSGSKGGQMAKGGIAYGGVFKLNEVQDFRNLYPLSVTDVISQRISNQVYEGLVELDQSNLTIKSCLAERWDVNKDATVFTFFIREGVKFHDDPCFPNGRGRDVTAADVKYCFDRICAADPGNKMFWLFKDKVIGANEYYESTLNNTPLEGGVSGIQVIDKNVIEIRLKFPFAGFLNILGHNACWIYPKEAVEEYDMEMRVHCVGTGPFRIKNIKEGEVVFLERNPHYWEIDQFGNQLPYLDGIKVTFNKDKKTEILEFRKMNLDMVYKLPLELVDEVLGDLEEAKKGGNIPFEMQIGPALNLFYYGFQHESKIFNNIHVRKAFNYAIDRESIVTFTLQGEGKPALYGVVPPFKGWDYEKVNGYNFDVEKAKTHMAKAGYPGGRGFPQLTLQINSDGGDINIQTAEVIQKMLEENLNIDIEIEVLPMSQHLELVESGKTNFWRSGWIADYPDPENFLTLFYSAHISQESKERSYLNTFRYKSAAFDSLYETALREIDMSKRFEILRRADQVVMDDAAIMPIFYEENTRLLQMHVKHFPLNAMEYRDFSEVYFIYEEGEE